MIRWLFILIQMLFGKKREPKKENEKNQFSSTKTTGSGYKEEEDRLVPPENGECHFDRLPIEMIAEILGKMTFENALALRLSCSRINEAYKTHRAQMHGPVIDVYVKFIQQTLVTSVRRGGHLISEAQFLPVHLRYEIFHNAQVTLFIRLGENTMTQSFSDEILSMFRHSKMRAVKLKSANCTEITARMINNLNPGYVDLTVVHYHEIISKIRNLEHLRVSEEIPFFIFSKILDLHILNVAACVTAASLPLIHRCINEYKESHRKIDQLHIRIPLMDLPEEEQEVTIDWRRHLVYRADKSGRLLHRRDTLTPAPGDTRYYQRLSWFVN